MYIFTGDMFFPSLYIFTIADPHIFALVKVIMEMLSFYMVKYLLCVIIHLIPAILRYLWNARLLM